MSLASIKLKDYDNVVAVTQVAINQTMGEYLMQHPTDMAVYAKDDGSGNITIVSDPSQATYTLTGTIAPEKDAQGKWIKLVKLKTDKGNQTILYNVTIQKGEFKGLGIDIKQNGQTPWVFSFFVDLAMQSIGKDALPAHLKKQLENVDENLFSIEQLYLDLNTASLDQIQGVTMPALLQSVVTAVMEAYLKAQQKKGKPLFGISVKYTDTKTLAPTLTPTYVNFCVTPYHDNTGDNKPALDTLNYLVMTDHRQPPSYTPKSFAFNWVEDINNQGAMAIRRQPFADFIVKQLNPLLKTLCPVMYCKADGTKKPPKDTVIKLKTGSDHVFDRTYNASSGLIASYSYNSHDSDTDKGPWYAPYTYTVSGKYSSTTQVYLKGDKIILSGTITASGSTETHIGRSNSETTMPATTYSWSVDLQLYMDAQNNGQLDLKVVNPSFDSKPVVAKHDQSWWQKFLNSLGGFMQSYTNDLGDLRGQVQGNIEGAVVTNLKAVLSKANHFIYPGANTFAFKNPTFSDTHNLAANITYLNPNA